VTTNQDRQLDALGDPTRRAVLKLLRDGPMPVTAIANQFPISRPAISQHLRVLKDAGLVTDTAVATQRLYQINPDAFVSLRAYFDDFWSVALSDFKKRADARQTKPAKRRRGA
jgi:DNA-binding transcriptional ArsR family regulator